MSPTILSGRWMGSGEGFGGRSGFEQLYEPRSRRVIVMVVSRRPEPSSQATSETVELTDEQLVAAELDLILARLEKGIPLENRRMDELLSRLRTTLIAA